jgi:hypothetical protein
LNADRNAIQVLGCNSGEIIAHLPLPYGLAAAVEAALEH